MSSDLTLGGTPLSSPTIQSRAITKENPNGAKGAGGQANNGRKGDPCLWEFKKDVVYTMANIEGPGCIRHIWMTVVDDSPQSWRNLILRFYWDDQDIPSVEAPITDFFGIAHGRRAPFECEYLSMAEGRSFNCWFLMPFAKNARLEIANETGKDIASLFFQVDYTIGDEVTDDTPRFHAQFRRSLRTTMKEDFVILDGVKGRGRFLGMTFGLIDDFPKPVWWGEGEVKMYIDGDTQYPTICGTGAEDYFGSGWGLGPFAHRYLGAPLADQRYVSCYRFHVTDPIYFTQDLRVTIQQIGNDGDWDPAKEDGPLGSFIKDGRYLKEARGGNFEREDDVCATAYWYQTLPTQPFPAIPGPDIRAARLDLGERDVIELNTQEG